MGIFAKRFQDLGLLFISNARRLLNKRQQMISRLDETRSLVDVIIHYEQIRRVQRSRWARSLKGFRT
jgi:hypothetical protein